MQKAGFVARLFRQNRPRSTTGEILFRFLHQLMELLMHAPGPGISAQISIYNSKGENDGNDLQHIVRFDNSSRRAEKRLHEVSITVGRIGFVALQVAARGSRRGLEQVAPHPEPPRGGILRQIDPEIEKPGHKPGIFSLRRALNANHGAGRMSRGQKEEP